MSIEVVKKYAESQLMAIKGVVGVSTAYNPLTRQWVLKVYVESEEVKRVIPRVFMGVPVEVVVTGPVGLLR